MKKIPKIYKVLLFFMGYPAYVFLTALRLPNFLIKKRLRENYTYNAAKTLAFPLCGQGAGELSTLRIGTKEFAHSGCCVIALFNALSIIGRKPKMCEIVSYMEKKGLVAYGMFGVNPVAIGKFLKKEGICFTRYKDMTQLEQDYAEGDSVISLYRWASAGGLGLHYVALKRENEVWKAYNVYSSSAQIYEYPDLKAFIAHNDYSKPVTWFLLKKEA